MRRVVLVLWCVVTSACDKSSVVAPAPMPTSPSPAVTAQAVTMFASIMIAGGNTLTTTSSGFLVSGVRIGQPVSLTLSVKSDDPVKDVSVDWGDGETADLGAVSQAVASHSFSTAGAFVVTAKVDMSSGRHITVPIPLTIGR
jgi:hypothetical protein